MFIPLVVLMRQFVDLYIAIMNHMFITRQCVLQSLNPSEWISSQNYPTMVKGTSYSIFTTPTHFAIPIFIYRYLVHDRYICTSTTCTLRISHSLCSVPAVIMSKPLNESFDKFSSVVKHTILFPRRSPARTVPVPHDYRLPLRRWLRRNGFFPFFFLQCAKIRVDLYTWGSGNI